MRPVLVFLVGLAGAVDGAAFLGAPLAFGSAQNRPFGYLEISLLLRGCAVGPRRQPHANQSRTVFSGVRADSNRRSGVGRGRDITGAEFADRALKDTLLLASVIPVGLVATVGATVIRVPVAGPRRRSALMIGVLVVIVIVASFMLLAAYAIGSAYSTFS